MEELLENIRAASATGATDDARTVGAQACRTLLAALEATSGEPLIAPPAPATAEASLSAPVPPPPSGHAAVHAVVSVLRGMTPDQLLDLAIARLRAALPPEVEVANPKAVNFHLVPVRR